MRGDTKSIAGHARQGRKVPVVILIAMIFIKVTTIIMVKSFGKTGPSVLVSSTPAYRGQLVGCLLGWPVLR